MYSCRLSFVANQPSANRSGFLIKIEDGGPIFTCNRTGLEGTPHHLHYEACEPTLSEMVPNG